MKHPSPFMQITNFMNFRQRLTITLQKHTNRSMFLNLPNIFDFIHGKWDVRSIFSFLQVLNFIEFFQKHLVVETEAWSEGKDDHPSEEHDIVEGILWDEHDRYRGGKQTHLEQ